MADFKYGDITEKIIGASFRVHSALGNGFQEVIYQRALQAMNYLEAYNLEIGLLINFGSKRLEFHRFTNKKYNPNIIQHPIKSQSSH